MPDPANLVHETSTTTGTGNFTVADANGRQSFNDAFGTGGTDTFDYFISHQSAAEWEYGTGHLSDASTLVRDTVINSSNSDAAVNFSAGTKDVTNDVPASRQITNATSVVQLLVFDDSEACSTGDGAGDIWFTVPSTLNGANLISARASVQTAGTTGSMTIEIHNFTDTADMLSTVLTVASGAVVDDGTAVVDTTNDDVVTDDRIRIDVDAVHTTPAQGLLVEMQFKLP